MGLSEVDLSEHEPEALRRALSGALEAESAQQTLVQGARATLQETDAAAAARFASLLEVAYLVASADGFVDGERSALADLLEQATGREASRDVLELHLRDLEDASTALGRRERLRRAAADLTDDASARAAVSFATLVALSDGRLASPEASVLSELAGDLDLSEEQLSEIVAGVVQRVRAALRS